MVNISFDQVKFRRLSEVIENHIRELILSGEVCPGDALPKEKELSQQFGVSLVTVREALKGLDSLGLIERRPGRNGGIFISEVKSNAVKTSLHHFLSLKKISYSDISEVRVILEPVSIRMAVSKITSSEISSLEENIKYCQQLIDQDPECFSKKDFSDFDEKNTIFHTIIAEATRNPLLAITIESEMDLLFKFKKGILTPGIEYCSDSLKSHRNILKHLKRRDAEKAEMEMKKHIGQLETYLMSKGINIELI